MAATPLTIFWSVLGRMVAQLLGERAHVVVSIVLKDGQIQLVRVDRTFLPGDLPRLPGNPP